MSLVCLSCSKPPLPGMSRCQRCREKRSAQCQRKITMGLCAYGSCNLPAVAGCRMCEGHRDKYRAYHKSQKAAKQSVKKRADEASRTLTEMLNDFDAVL